MPNPWSDAGSVPDDATTRMILRRLLIEALDCCKQLQEVGAGDHILEALHKLSWSDEAPANRDDH